MSDQTPFFSCKDIAMKQEYRSWISEHVEADGFGKCRETTQAMIEAFPELRRVRGHYYCAIWGEREHWWLETEDGKIVDPTAEQFPSRGFGEYIEWDESQRLPTGMCPNCGGYAYDGNTCCSDACSAAYAAYCRNP